MASNRDPPSSGSSPGRNSPDIPFSQEEQGHFLESSELVVSGSHQPLNKDSGDEEEFEVIDESEGQFDYTFLCKSHTLLGVREGITKQHFICSQRLYRESFSCKTTVPRICRFQISAKLVSLISKLQLAHVV
jgi:hypothetical protein